ncbi:hypothetical protein EDD15DRAFT_2362386 [Pisolithus albus]|nr:hypothetical protein EDD15DRAFT_2362386 [Pisolithus albus]
MGSKANESASHRRLRSTWPLAGQPIIGDTPAGPQRSITSFHSLGQGVPFFPFDTDPSSMTLRMFIKTQDLAHTGVGDSSSAQDGSGSGEASTGHQEEAGSGGASGDISSAQDRTGSGEASTGHVEASGDISSAQDGGGSGEASTGHAEASGDSSSLQVDSGSGEASTGHAEEGGSEKH